MPETLAIILARAGSKGLPNKNALPLAGKPMLRWTIDHARHSETIDHIVVSTDGNQLTQIAQDAGIEVISRPDELSHDSAAVDAAARHALTEFENRYPNRDIQHVAILYGNVPIRPADLTDRAINKLIDTNCDSVQSVYQVGKTHPYWMRTLTGPANDQMGQYQPNNIHRRQDLPPVYMLNGGIIAVTRKSLLTTKPNHPHAFLGTDQRAIVCNEDEVVDIDSYVDLRLAETILTQTNQTQS